MARGIFDVPRYSLESLPGNTQSRQSPAMFYKGLRLVARLGQLGGKAGKVTWEDAKVMGNDAQLLGKDGKVTCKLVQELCKPSQVVCRVGEVLERLVSRLFINDQVLC